MAVRPCRRRGTNFKAESGGLLDGNQHRRLSGYPSAIKGALRADLGVTVHGPYRLGARLEREDFKISDIEGSNPDRARTLYSHKQAAAGHFNYRCGIPKCTRVSREKERLQWKPHRPMAR